MKTKLDITWQIFCPRICKVWLALPLKCSSQKILSEKLPVKTRKVKNKLYSYIYFKSNKNRKISAQIELEVKKIVSYKEVCSNLFLKNNKLLRVKKIKSLALKLKTPKKFYEWIIKNIKFPKDLSPYLKNLNWTKDAYSILDSKEGECSGKSILFVALCRAINIPARIISGYFIKDGEISLKDAKFDKTSLELHQWAEFFDGNYWIPVDCSLAQEEKKDYFGKLDDYRIIISKDFDIPLINNGKLNFLQIGELKPRGNIFLKIKFKK